MDKVLTEPQDYRYERKFFVAELTKHEIEALVKLHPAMFSEIYYPRSINNIYLDLTNMKSYFDNVDGLQNWMKVRIRWYGDLFGCVEEPVLEFKMKNGLLGRKESFPLVPFSVDENLQGDCIREVFKMSDIPENLKLELTNLDLSLIIRYRRKYFQSVDRRYRITIDSELEYYNVGAYNNTFLHKSVDLLNTVVELKYDSDEDRAVERITNFFPFRMTKSSKYVNGIESASL